MRASGFCELIRWTFEVMFSVLRSFRGGILWSTAEGSIIVVVVIVFSGWLRMGWIVFDGEKGGD